MKYFVLSDIHEDFFSLEMALDFISKETSEYKIISLGDNIGYSSYFLQSLIKRDANKCIDLLKENNIISLLGNHDLNFLNKLPQNSFYLFSENLENKKNGKSWSYNDEMETILTDSNKYYIEELKEFFIEEEIIFSHFLYPDLTGNLVLTKETLKLFVKTHFILMSLNHLKISFVGHVHFKTPVIILDNGQEFRLLKSNDEIILNFEENSYIIFCPPLLSYLSENSNFISYCNHTNVIKYHCLAI